jgi:hypothetical protein
MGLGRMTGARYQQRPVSSIAARCTEFTVATACCEGEISPLAPASILRTHPNTTIYLDKRSAALLSAAVPIAVQR